MNGPFHFPEILSLEWGIVNLLEKLRGKIDEMKYGILIGDDISGRIMTLLLKKIFDRRYGEIIPGEKFKEIKTVFISGDRFNTDKKKIVEYFKKLKGTFRGEALLVTEYISTGERIFLLADCLKEAEISFEVASLSVAGKTLDFSLRDLKFRKLGINIYTGNMTILPDIYGRHDLAGVEKNLDSIFSKRVKTWLISETAKTAREDVRKLSILIYDTVFNS